MAGYHRTIDDFKTLLSRGGGLSTPTRYAVEIMEVGGEGEVEWKGMEGSGGTKPASSNLFHPENITLPSRSFSTIADTHFGPVRQYPHRRQYNSEIVMTFISSENQWERSYFEQWMDLIIDKNNNINPYSLSNMSDNMFIYVLNHSDEATGKFSLDGVYPSSIIPANYGYGMINEYAKFQVTFRYRDYKFERI